MEFQIIILLVGLAFMAELIDSSMGMMYGTLLSPLLIVLGFDPLVVVPSLLLTQAFGGFIASMFHQKLCNADFRPRNGSREFFRAVGEKGLFRALKDDTTRDFRVVFIVSSLGVLATIFAALAAVSIPENYVKLYIGILVLAMGAILLSRIRFDFSSKKILFIGLLSSFNKGLSGGGFGPVVTSGQVISGNGAKRSVGATTLSEAPICLTGFLVYYLTEGFSDWPFLLALGLGAVAAAPLGALLTSHLNEAKIRPLLGLMAVGLGLWALYKLFF